jgi:proline iminopeptidase
MNRIILFLVALFFVQVNAQTSTIYSKAYGKNTNPVIIFIHGGPSGNATLFEATTAQKLAERGFFVIAYDRRGEGRSVDSTATFTYEEAISDLNKIYRLYNIQKANLIAHSFGGLVGTLFTEQNPRKVNALILAGALFSQQETYDHILNTTKEIYRKQNDSLMLSKITEIEGLDKNSAAYRKQCFELAGQNNYFKMPYPTAEATLLRKNYELSDFYKNNIRNAQAPILFYQNESRNNIDTKPILKNIKKKVKLFAIYGQHDKIFSEKQLSDLQTVVTKKNFKMIENCSHYLFADQQQIFIDSIIEWIKTN